MYKLAFIIYQLYSNMHFWCNRHPPLPGPLTIILII